MRNHSRITDNILSALPSPCWILEEHLLANNLALLASIKKQTGVKILLALKGFAFWQEAEMIMAQLDGCCASGLHEALLAKQKFGGEVHTYAPAFKKENITDIARLSQHMVFNTPSQLMQFGSEAKKANPSLSMGLRVNPESSHAPVELYNPCAPYSRLGTKA